MFHCNGWCYTRAVTAVGGTHICLRKLDRGLVWELFDTEGVTHCNGAPTVQIFLVNHPKAHRLNRQVTTAVGGAPPSPTLLEQMKALNIRPIHLYGLTETYGPYVICEWHAKWDTLQEIIAFCRERLARFKCPAAVDFGDLPKTSTGKVQKYVPREKEWRGREKRIH
jgi:fatty-acyl-CoA synthase